MRRTLKYIKSYPSPNKLYNRITNAEGWHYKTDLEFYKVRDKALISLLYLLALRVSEALRLKRGQFEELNNRVLVSGIKLSKSKLKDKPRREQYRQENWLPLNGERSKLTDLVLNYLQLLDIRMKDRLFKFGRVRAYQIVTTYLDEPCHWLRAYGENYLYDSWDHDILAVSDYVKVDPRTLQQYIRGGFRKYKSV